MSGISLLYTVDEIIHAFKVAEPTPLIVDKQSLTAASKAAQKIWLPQTQLLLIDGHVDG
jgi:hypothetical protein